MKRICSFVLALGLIVSLCACGKTEITMQEIYDVSHLDALLENHESVYVQYMLDGQPYEETYLSKEYSYSLYFGEFYGLEFDFANLTTDNAFYFYDGSYALSLLISPDGLTDTYRPEDSGVFVLEPDSVTDTIQSVKKSDGRITVTSFADQEKIAASEDMGLVSSNSEFVLDAKTQELISLKNVVEYEDGTVYNVAVDFIYDGEIPEGMKTFVEYAQETEALRTITVVSNPGTEKEKSESVQAPKGLSVLLEPDFDGAFDLYSDAACTEPFAFDEENAADVTIYVKWAE